MAEPTVQQDVQCITAKQCNNMCRMKHTGCFITFSVITNIYNKKTKVPTLMELFIARGKLIFFFN
jgi:hypothetical protein